MCLFVQSKNVSFLFIIVLATATGIHGARNATGRSRRVDLGLKASPWFGCSSWHRWFAWTADVSGVVRVDLEQTEGLF
jgi:hypothetical protein